MAKLGNDECVGGSRLILPILFNYWIFSGKLIIYLEQDERRPEQMKPRSVIRLRPNL